MILVERNDLLILTPELGEDCSGLVAMMAPRIAAGTRKVVVDLQGIAYLNSVTIAAFLTLRANLHAQGGQMAIAHVAPAVAAVFRILKLERLFALGLDHDAAMAVVNAAPQR